VDNANSPPGVPHLALSYTYDKVSNRLTLSDSSNGGVTYSYDAAERLTGAWMFASGSTSVPQITLGYDLDGQLRVVGRQIGGTAQITSSYDYTPRNQVKYIQHTSSSAGTLATYTYTYDDALRLTTYMGPEGTVTFGYDSTNQLTSASRSMPESYGYDNNGNRNTGSYMTAAGNRLTFNGTYTYTYDNQGNVLTKFDSAGDVATYTWDFRNRLTRGQTSGVNLGTHDVTFTYDMFDRRIEKSTSSGNTWTVYDEANPYADFSGSMLQYRYLYGRTVDALFARFDGTSGNDSTIWYLTENLGSVRQMAKTDGTVTATITYDSFGQIQGTFIGDRFKFAGREYDSETGLYYNRERYYDPSVGRFLSEDPLGLRAGDSNLYRYVGNAPTWRIDPSGLDWANDLIGAFCVAVWGPVYGPAVYRVVDSGPVGGAVEGGSVGLGVGILAGLAVGSLNPAAGAGGGIVGSLAGAGYGAQLGSSQPDFFTGAAAAGDPRTIVVGLAGGILGGEVGNRIFPAQPPPSATSA